MDSSTSLTELYSSIQEKTEHMAEIYDKIKYVERFGVLPPVENNRPASGSINDLKVQKRSLENRRSKLRVKLKPNAKRSANSPKVLEWELTLAQLDAEYDDVIAKIKQLENGE